MENIDMEQLQALLARAQEEPSDLVEFRAGQLTLSAGMVTPDKRRGKVNLIVQDGLLHFQWKTRPANVLAPQDDIIVMPGDAVFEKVPECADGRVYVLRFVSSSRRRFFWMQSPTNEKDDETVKRVNELLKNGPGASANGLAGLLDAQGNVDEDQLMALLSGQGAVAAGANANASVAAAVTPAAARVPAVSATPVVTPAAARVPAVSATPVAARPTFATSAATAAPAAASVGGDAASLATARALAEAFTVAPLSLKDVMDPAILMPLLEQEEVQATLLPLLPEGQRTLAFLKANVRSPQFHQTLARLTGVLNGAQYGSVMQSLSLPADQGFGVLGFIDAVEKKEEEEKKEKK